MKKILILLVAICLCGCDITETKRTYINDGTEVKYYRYDENYSREKEKENIIEPLTCSKEELKSIEDFFKYGWVEKLFEKAID